MIVKNLMALMVLSHLVQVSTGRDMTRVKCTSDDGTWAWMEERDPNGRPFKGRTQRWYGGTWKGADAGVDCSFDMPRKNVEQYFEWCKMGRYSYAQPTDHEKKDYQCVFKIVDEKVCMPGLATFRGRPVTMKNAFYCDPKNKRQE